MPFEIRKLNNNKFQVYNVETGRITSKGTTKKKAQLQLKLLNHLHHLEGKGLSISTLKNVIKNGYAKKKDDNIDGYKLDDSLSGNRVTVLHNPDTNHTIVNHKGTASLNDWWTDLKLGLFNDKSGARFQHSKKIQKEAEDKYKDSKFTVTGHSLGSKLAQEANTNNHEFIGVNGAYTPYDLFNKKKDNETHIRSSLDPVSYFDPKNDITIKSKTYNPLTEHSSDILSRLDPNTYVGGQLAPIEYRGMPAQLFFAHVSGMNLEQIQSLLTYHGWLPSYRQALERRRDTLLAQQQLLIQNAPKQKGRKTYKGGVLTKDELMEKKKDLDKLIEQKNINNFKKNPNYQQLLDDALGRIPHVNEINRLIKQESGGNINTPEQKLIELQKYSDPKRVQKNARRYFQDDVTVYVSTNKNKKYMVKNPTNNKYVHFGEIGFEDFTKHKDKKRQSDYLSRATKIKGNWKSNRFSPNNLSINLLWQ